MPYSLSLTQPTGEAQRRKSVRTRKLLFVVLLSLLAVLLLGSCGPGKYTPKPNEEIYGTWINEKMDMQKCVVTAEGWKQYHHTSDPGAFYEGTGQTVAKWSDSQGNIWYKGILSVTKGGTIEGYKFYTLDKLSKSATVWEEMFFVPMSDQEMKNPKYPTKIDPTDTSHYMVYYRAKE